MCGGVIDDEEVCFGQNDQQETAVKALESLCEHSKDEAQVLTALRSVTNKKNHADMKSVKVSE